MRESSDIDSSPSAEGPTPSAEGPTPGAEPHHVPPTPLGPVSSGGSIGRRLTLALVGVSVLTLLAVGTLFYGFLGQYVVRQKQDQMLAHATAVADQFGRIWSEASLSPIRSTRDLELLLSIDTQVLPPGAGITIFQGDDIVATAGPERVRGRAGQQLYPRAAKLAAGGPSAATFASQGRTRLIVAAAPMALAGQAGMVVVSLPTAEAVSARRGLFGVLLLSGIIAVAVAVLAGLGLGSWLTRPLIRLSRSARAMAAGSYAEPVQGAYPGEIYTLASSMETMRREVRRSEQSLRGFVASAAHELRTPLTSIEGFSQALLDGTADTTEDRRRSAAAIYRESSRLHRLVNALLTLSRYDSREYRPGLVEIDGARVAQEEVDRLVEAGLADAGRIRVSSPNTDPALLVTDPDMLRQVVGNLLRNAVQYGGDDPIEATAAVRGEVFVLEVANGGHPVSPLDRDHLFERFYRGHTGRRTDGFGLGLPLVREICEVLGGTVELTPERTHTVFRVTLPVQPVG